MAAGSPNWEELLALYSSGASDVEIAKELGITYARFLQLCEDNDAFLDFAEKGRTMSRAWWFKQARIGLFADKFNASVYNFAMKNLHGWADKVDTNDVTDKDPVNLDQAAQQLRSAMKKLAKKNPEILRGLNDE